MIIDFCSSFFPFHIIVHHIPSFLYFRADLDMSRQLVILYASETGNSQDYAYTLSKKCEQQRFQVEVSSLDDYDLKNIISDTLIFFLISTTGQGDFPRNGRKFWKFMLRKKLPNDLLSNLKFTTFGLGDSSYPKYNWAIRKFHKRLLQLGAKQFCGRGEGDEQSPEGIDGHYTQWEQLVLASLSSLWPLPDGIEPISDDELMLPKNPVIVNLNKLKRDTEHNIKKISISRPTANIASIKENKRITADNHFQDVRHLILESEDTLDYEPGDTIALMPSNDPKEVQFLISSQGWDDIADRQIVIEGKLPSIEGGLIKPLTLRSFITHHLDIYSIPRRSFFSLFWHFAKDEREREKLKELSTMEGSEDLYDYCNRPRRSILEVITEFFSAKIPVEYLFDLIPILKPRLFSIASSPDPFKVELCIAIVQYRTVIKKIRRGACTKWITTLNEGDRIPFKLIKSPLKIKDKKNVPLIMIAPGTGVAPIRSLIKTISESSNSITTNESNKILFFGCRFKEKDFLFKDEWKELVEQHKLKLIAAFSREGGGYVQGQLYNRAEELSIADLIVNKEAVIYICGSSGAMPKQVRITLQTILKETQEWNDEKTNQYLIEMENKHRYIQETW